MKKIAILSLGTSLFLTFSQEARGIIINYANHAVEDCPSHSALLNPNAPHPINMQEVTQDILDENRGAMEGINLSGNPITDTGIRYLVKVIMDPK